MKLGRYKFRHRFNRKLKKRRKKKAKRVSNMITVQNCGNNKLFLKWMQLKHSVEKVKLQQEKEWFSFQEKYKKVMYLTFFLRARSELIIEGCLFAGYTFFRSEDRILNLRHKADLLANKRKEDKSQSLWWTLFSGLFLLIGFVTGTTLFN